MYVPILSHTLNFDRSKTCNMAAYSIRVKIMTKFLTVADDLM